jgi:hypothetical protein
VLLDLTVDVLGRRAGDRAFWRKKLNNSNTIKKKLGEASNPEAVFLVVCDPSMNEL